jgi:hypothetical protein
MPRHGDVRLYPTGRAANPAFESALAVKADTLVQLQRPNIALLSDQLDARNVRMTIRDLIEESREELPPDSPALSSWMNRHGKIAQNVSEDAQLAAVRVELRGQAR